MFYFALLALGLSSFAMANEASTTLVLDGTIASQSISLKGEGGYIQRREVPTGQTCERKVSLGTQCKDQMVCRRWEGNTCTDYSYQLVCQEAYRTEYYSCTRIEESFVKTNDTVAEIKVNFISFLPSSIVPREELSAKLNLAGTRLELKAKQLTGKVALYQDSSRIVTSRTPDGKFVTIKGEIDLKMMDPAVVLNAASKFATNFVLSAEGLSFDLPETKNPENLNLTLSLSKKRFLGKKTLISDASLASNEYEISSASGVSRVFISMRQLVAKSSVSDIESRLTKGTFKIELNVLVNAEVLILDGANVGELVPGTLVGQDALASSAKIKLK
ncbi:MAG: hypothetical protein A2428_17640 [Bdellovibrionales bacterium RIFOXYC1_FULL_54_43]|nr:MAG: hypothetical protein A2428_17640 [Bdellovibrionales bacterium RIFOXYC1_FULL_54_43]OFZ79509.1 MAG: hypothetical protein A2603_09880 [Bdellovibrionales bacterium RIFOXYD1_FULL_55_31]